MQGWGNRLRILSVEQHALRLYALAGAYPIDPPGPAALVEALGGDLAIHRGNEFPEDWHRVLYFDDDSWAVELHPNLSVEMATVLVARGLVEWYASRPDVCLDADCDLGELADAVLLPEPALRVALTDRELSADDAADDVADNYRLPVSTARARLVKCGLVLRRSGCFHLA